MERSNLKIWTGVGAYFLLSTCSTAIISQTSPAKAQTVDEPFLGSAIAFDGSNSSSALMFAQGGEGEAEAKPPEFKNKLSGAALVDALRGGGYIIYFRHPQTEVDYADQITAKMGYCNTQRMLSETGWRQARAIGQAFQELKIPVGKVYSSEYCRAWQGADLAFGRYEKTPALNFLPAEEYTEAQVRQMKAAVMPLLTAVPAKGTNTVIMGHDDIFEAATGIYPEPQGVAFILKPDSQGKFEIIAMVLPEEWAKLSRQ